MKLLFIRNADRFSGSETYDVNLFAEARKNTTNRIYLLTNLPSLAERVSNLGFMTYITPWGEEGIGTKKQLLRAIVRLPVFVSHYLSLINLLEKEERFDVICLQSMTEKIFLTPILKARGSKIVWTELGPIYATRMSRIITFLYKIVSQLVETIITISDDTKYDLVKGGVNRHKIVAIHIGINIRKYKPLSRNKIKQLRKQFRISQRTTVIGFLGTITVEKGIYEFVQISKILLKYSNQFHFMVIGDGDLLKLIKSDINKVRLLRNYTFTNFVNDVASPLGTVDILLLPTLHLEGTPLAILEAQSMGKVVITRDIGGNKEIVTNNVNGYIYNGLSNMSIADLIIKLTGNIEKMNKLGINARINILKKFNIHKQASRFFEKINNL